MAKKPNQKMKIMYLRDFMIRETDEDHRVTVKDMISYLDSVGISAERKTIYSDLNELIDYGVDIISVKRVSTEYYVGDRDFQLSELRVLIDAACQSRFLTEKKTKVLTEKLMDMCSVHEKKWLGGQLYIPNNYKSLNEGIYSTIFTIHSAIATGNAISFNYWSYGRGKEKLMRNNAEKYIVEPCMLTWSDGNYYLVGRDKNADKLKTYRVDKMAKIDILEIKIGQIYEEGKLIKFIKEQFSMFDGSTTQVTLEFNDEMTGTILDRFGMDAKIIAGEMGKSRLLTNVKASRWFYSWLVGMGESVKIVSPDEVRDDYYEYLQSIISRQQI